MLATVSPSVWSKCLSYPHPHPPNSHPRIPLLFVPKMPCKSPKQIMLAFKQGDLDGDAASLIATQAWGRDTAFFLFILPRPAPNL